MNDQDEHLTDIRDEDRVTKPVWLLDEPGAPDYSHTSVGMTDADLRAIMVSSMRLTAVLGLLLAVGLAWRLNWQSAALLLIGAVISTTSLWEWLRLTTAMNAIMDAKPDSGAAPKALSTGLIPVTFLLRIGLTLCVLYVSLRYLHGTPFALAAGLALGVISLSIEAFRLLRRAPK